jgi:hypothetical protein
MVFIISGCISQKTCPDEYVVFSHPINGANFLPFEQTISEGLYIQADNLTNYDIHFSPGYDLKLFLYHPINEEWIPADIRTSYYGVDPILPRKNSKDYIEAFITTLPTIPKELLSEESLMYRVTISGYTMDRKGNRLCDFSANYELEVEVR